MEVNKQSFFAPSVMERATKLFIFLIILLLINCGNVFAKTNIQYLNESLEQLGYYNFFKSYETTSTYKTQIYDNKTYYEGQSDIEELYSILDTYDWLVFEANLNFDNSTSIAGNTQAIFGIYCGYGEEPYNYDYTKIVNKRVQRFWFKVKYDPGRVDANLSYAKNLTTVNVDKHDFELWIDNGQIKYSNGYAEPIKKAYFEYSAEKIGTTNINNNIIPCFYPSSFNTNGNSYATYKRIGKLYIEPTITMDEVYSSIPTIKVQNLEQTKTWEYKNYLIFTDNTIENGYKVYTINIDINYINTPYIYTMELKTRNEELGEDIIIKFALLTQTTGGGIVIESGDTELSGDFTKDDTTIGDIENTITEPYDPNKNILNNMKSGDILNNMGYEVNEDPNEDLWDTIINGLKDTLTGSGDVILEFPLRSKTIEVSSNQIKQPESDLKTFTGLFVNFWLLMQMFTFIKKTIDQINEGDLKVMHDVDADCYFF